MQCAITYISLIKGGILMTFVSIAMLLAISCSCFAVVFFLREYLDLDIYALCWLLVMGILTGITGIVGLYFLITYYSG